MSTYTTAAQSNYEIEFADRNQNWQDETTNYWFLVDGESYAISDCNGVKTLLDCDGCPIEPCNDRGGVFNALINQPEIGTYE